MKIVYIIREGLSGGRYLGQEMGWAWMQDRKRASRFDDVRDAARMIPHLNTLELIPDGARVVALRVKARVRRFTRADVTAVAQKLTCFAGGFAYMTAVRRAEILLGELGEVEQS